MSLSFQGNKALPIAGGAVAASLVIAFAITRMRRQRKNPNEFDFNNNGGSDITIHSAHALEQFAATTVNDDTVHLFTFPATALAPSLSPFGTKVETFLRIARIPYKTHSTFRFSVSPNGCVPFIVCRGQVIADSQTIIEHLTVLHGVKHMDLSLTQAELAVANAGAAMFSWTLVPGVMRSIFIEDGGRTFMPYVAPVLGVPRVFRRLFAALFSKELSTRQRTGGLLTTTREQFESSLLRDLEALEAMLSERPFLATSYPTSIDCAMYAILLPVIRVHRLALGAFEGGEEDGRDSSSSISNNNNNNDKSDDAKNNNNSNSATEESEDVRDFFISEPLQYVYESPILNNYVDRITALAFPGEMEEQTPLTASN